MANDCLVTKLKGSVKNDSLVRLGCINLEYGYTGDDQKGFISIDTSGSLGEIVRLNALDGGYFGTSPSSIETERLTTIDTNSPQHFFNAYLTPGHYRIEIENYYSIYQIAANNLIIFTHEDLEKLAYMPYINYCSVYSDREGDSSFIKQIGPKFENGLIIHNFGICNLGDLTTIPSVTIFAEYLNGNITELCTNTSLKKISLTCDAARTRVSGTIESFVEGQVANGRVSGTIDYGIVSNVTLNNKLIYNCIITFSDTNVVITNDNIQIATYTIGSGTWEYYGEFE